LHASKEYKGPGTQESQPHFKDADGAPVSIQINRADTYLSKTAMRKLIAPLGNTPKHGDGFFFINYQNAFLNDYSAALMCIELEKDASQIAEPREIAYINLSKEEKFQIEKIEFSTTSLADPSFF